MSESLADRKGSLIRPIMEYYQQAGRIKNDKELFERFDDFYELDIERLEYYNKFFTEKLRILNEG